MAWFSPGRKNGSINDLAPILAQILIDIQNERSVGYSATESSMARVISSRVSGYEFELTNKYINRLAKMLYDTLTAIQRSKLIQSLHKESKWLTQEGKIEGKLNNIFSSREDFEIKLKQHLVEIIKAQMLTADL